jgi:hypothetical protein
LLTVKIIVNLEKVDDRAGLLRYVASLDAYKSVTEELVGGKLILEPIPTLDEKLFVDFVEYILLEIEQQHWNRTGWYD